MHEPYRPPSASLSEPPVQRRGSSLAAVLIGGVVVDCLGTLLLGLVMVFAWTAGAMMGGDPDAIGAALETPAFLAASTALGALMSVAGGFVAGRWAGRRPALHGAAAGALALALWLPVLLLPGAETEPLWLTVASVVFQVPLAAWGGSLAGRRSA